MNTVERIENSFTDRFAADCARVSFGSNADDYSDKRVAGLIDYLVRNRHINPLFHPMITFQASSIHFDYIGLLENKTLLAGLNMYYLGMGEWAITTSAWGLLEFVKWVSRNQYFHVKVNIDGVPAICESYNKHVNLQGNKIDVREFDIKIIETPRHHQWFTFRLNTEMNTKNQLYTHTVGLVKSSQSFRYVDDIEFYIPHEWRGKAENIKQGSSDEVVCENNIGAYNAIVRVAHDWYCNNNHICNEQRRYILPQAQMTKYVITGTREAWDRVLKLRLAKNAQKEVRLIAENIADEIASDKVWV
jgi:thymidylate synthase (FAD)